MDFPFTHGRFSRIICLIIGLASVSTVALDRQALAGPPGDRSQRGPVLSRKSEPAPPPVDRGLGNVTKRLTQVPSTSIEEEPAIWIIGGDQARNACSPRRLIGTATLGAALALGASAAADERLTTTEKLRRLDEAFPPRADKKGSLRNLTREALGRGTEPLDELRAFLDEPGYAVVELSATWCEPCRASYRAYASFAGRTDARYAMLVIDEEIVGEAGSRDIHARFGEKVAMPSYYVFCDMEAIAPPVHTLDGLRGTLARASRQPCRPRRQ